MPSIMVDNSPSAYRFRDGNPLSDGMASFAASIINAGPAAAQVRRQREQDSVAQAFQQAQGARADRSLDLQSLWHQQANDMNLAKAGVYAGEDPAMIDMARQVKLAGAQKAQTDQAQIDRQGQQLDLQTQLTKAQIANMQSDNARAALGQWGDGINEAVKRGVDIAKLFTGRTGSTQPRILKASDKFGAERFYTLENGQMRELPMMKPGMAPGTGPMPPGAAPSPAGAPSPGAAPNAPTTTPAPQPLSRQQLERLPTAEQRATSTLTTMSLPPEQKAVLARVVAAAKAQDQQAILWLLEWDAAQPDTQEQEARNKQLNDAMMRVDEATPAMYR